jgi:hypothetical protein
MTPSYSTKRLTTHQESFTPEQIATWLLSAESKSVELERLLNEPLYSTFREAAVHQMWHLFKEAIEEVRVLSDTLQEDSQTLRSRARDVRQRSTALCERSAQARAYRCQDGPSAEAVHPAEQRMLDQFKDGLR